MTEEDEEVIPVNSELYKVLRAIGFENDLPRFQNDEDNLNKHTSTDEMKEQKPETDCILYELDSRECQKLIGIIMNGNLIFREDMSIIQSFMVFSEDELSLLSIEELKTRFLNSKIPRDMLILNIFGIIILRSISVKKILVCSGIPCVLYSFRYLYGLYGKWERQRTMVSLMDNLISFSEIINRSSQLVHENLVIMFSEIHSKTSQPFRPQCYNMAASFMMRNLCQITVEVIRTVVMELKTAILFLLAEFPLKKHEDDCEYLAKLNEEDLIAVDIGTSTLSMDRLRKLKYVLYLLRSEFLRRLCLCFVPQAQARVVNVGQLFRRLDALNTIICREREQLKKHFRMNYTSAEHVNKPVVRGEAHTKVRNFAVSLQAVLGKCLELEDTLEVDASMPNQQWTELVSRYAYAQSVFDDLSDHMNRGKPRMAPSVLHTDTTEETNVVKTGVNVGRSNYEPDWPDEVYVGRAAREELMETENESEEYMVDRRIMRLLTSELKESLKQKERERKEREKAALKKKRIDELDTDGSMSDEDLGSESSFDGKTELNESDTGESITFKSIKELGFKLPLLDESVSDSVSYDGESDSSTFTFNRQIAEMSSKWNLKTDEFQD